MALPSLSAALNTGFPVVVCARPWAEDLLNAYPLHSFIPMTGNWQTDRKRVAAHRSGEKNRKAVGLLLPDSLSSALVFRLAGIQCAGYRDDGRSLLLKWPIAKPEPKPHAVVSWYTLTLQALEKWHLTAPQTHPDSSLNLTLTQQHKEAAETLLKKAQLKANNFVLIAPTATGRHKGKNKVWPKFNSLTRTLQKKGYTVVMCPPPAEKQEALQNAPTALCLDSLSLGAFATLAGMATLVICNDSGVSHLASAAGARQITLFGVTHREHTGPWSPNAICVGEMGQWPTDEEVLNHTMPLLQFNKSTNK